MCSPWGESLEQKKEKNTNRRNFSIDFHNKKNGKTKRKTSREKNVRDCKFQDWRGKKLNWKKKIKAKILKHVIDPLLNSTSFTFYNGEYCSSFSSSVRYSVNSTDNQTSRQASEKKTHEEENIKLSKNGYETMMVKGMRSRSLRIRFIEWGWNDYNLHIFFVFFSSFFLFTSLCIPFHQFFSVFFLSSLSPPQQNRTEQNEQFS